MVNHPNLDEQTRAKRYRNLKVATGVIGIGVIVLFLWLILSGLAGRWGVPGFAFTNDNGSQCRNNVTGYTCSPMTLRDIKAATEFDLPDESVVRSSLLTMPNHEVQAQIQLTAQQAEAFDLHHRLQQAYGDCSPLAASPLNSIPDLTDLCVRTNMGVTVTEAEKATTKLWRVSVANTPEGNVLVDFDIRNR
ncbi:hypothetical protein [Granulicoccus phenolivorans]|uniref:hypothetical protein n=1 Tax=Granulicoccus phenolivorans TaxID=266854 RepID=UPI0003F5584D|nr:hypothetical protein [Granulicoccus phenolivorans]